MACIEKHFPVAPHAAQGTVGIESSGDVEVLFEHVGVVNQADTFNEVEVDAEERVRFFSLILEGETAVSGKVPFFQLSALGSGEGGHIVDDALQPVGTFLSFLNFALNFTRLEDIVAGKVVQADRVAFFSVVVEEQVETRIFDVCQFFVEDARTLFVSDGAE